MHARLAVALLALVAAAPAAAQDLSRFRPDDPATAIRVDHSPWAAFLERYVVAAPPGPNLVRYGAVTEQDKSALAAYIAALEATDARALSRDEAFAYWVNLYNAITVKLILDHYPVTSIREIKSGLISIGPWGRRVATVSGVSLSLDDIEHKILRAYFGDNRVHYAVNCASIGCPDLKTAPWMAVGLDAALDAAARAYVNSPRGARVENGRIVVSAIYNWFKDDFGGAQAGVLDHLRTYAEEPFRSRLETATRIDGFDYDWTLNDAAP